jgi:hypothetical protein
MHGHCFRFEDAVTGLAETSPRIVRKALGRDSGSQPPGSTVFHPASTLINRQGSTTAPGVTFPKQLWIGKFDDVSMK